MMQTGCTSAPGVRLAAHWQPCTRLSAVSRPHVRSARRGGLDLLPPPPPIAGPFNSDIGTRRVACRFRPDEAAEAFQQDTLPLRVPQQDLEVMARAAKAWQQLCLHGPPAPPTVAVRHAGSAPAGVAAAHYDVVVLGGTLGILLATALLAASSSSASSASSSGGSGRRLRVAVVERGVLAGREQEWNCTAADLQVLVELGVLGRDQVAALVATHIPAVRMGVAGGPPPLVLHGVMDAGVSPAALLDALRRRFEELGGQLLEHTAFASLDVYDDAAHLNLTQQQAPAGAGSDQAGGAGGRQASFGSTPGDAAAAAGDRTSLAAAAASASLAPGAGVPTAAAAASAASAAAAAAAAAGGSGSGAPLVLSADLVLDALGSFSPLSAQARGAQQQAPEAAMLLVGSCVDAPGAQQHGAAAAAGAAEGAAPADVLWGLKPIDSATAQQYWFERFPAHGGSALTTYMFAFTDPAPANAGLLGAMGAAYGACLGEYLGVPPEQLAVRRGVSGFVPCYGERVPPLVDRLLPVGDSAANRSALSLAGFCALLRHLGRLTRGILEALDAGVTSKQALALLQPWCPGVTATTAMQRAMSVYSCQAATVRRNSEQAAAAAAADGGTGGSAAAPGREVLSLMGASFAAMWAAAGEEGVRPFVADRIQFGPLAASIVTQIRQDPGQLLAYSSFLGGDTRGAARLITGLAGLALYGALAAALPLTGPLHEVLLGPRLLAAPGLLYAWHRHADAWLYGSGADWQQQQQQQQCAQGWERPAGADGSSGGGSGPSSGVGCLPARASGRSSSAVMTAPAWGATSGSRRAAASIAGPRWLLPRSRRQARAVAAAALGSSSSSDGADGAPEDAVGFNYYGADVVPVERYDRCDLVEAFCRLAVAQQGRPREDVYAYQEPRGFGAAGSASTGSSSSAAAAFPAWCEPLQSMDCADVIDWSNVENDGWGGGGSGGGGAQEEEEEEVLPVDSERLSPRGRNASSSSSSSHGRGDGSSGRGSRRPGATAAAAAGGHPPALGAVARCAGLGGSALPAVACCWGGSLRTARAPRAALLGAAAVGVLVARSRRGAVVARASPSPGGTAGDASQPGDASPHYEGADSDALFPPGCPEMDDPAALSGAEGDGQARVVRPEQKPYMNIVGGRWVPPSKAEAEKMMGQLSNMGPDEGV